MAIVRACTILTIVSMLMMGCWSVGSKANAVSESPTMEDSPQKNLFLKNLPKAFEHPADDAGRLLLREYGAVFLARNGAVPPTKVVFRDEADVAAFQASFERASDVVAGTKVELQAAAMRALNAVRSEADRQGLSISPRGADSARRGYNQTVSLWASRVNPGLAHWVAKGRISQSEAKRIKSLSPYEQVPEILKLEQQNIFFAKDLSKSIIYSVAPPGTSQHLSLLALDVKQFNDARVRAILAKHGWFQTVVSDLPHFTYIGVRENELPGLGLKKVVNAGRDFWIPDV